MSKKEKILNILLESESQNGDTRFETLGIAADLAQELTEKDWENHDIIAYILKWMIHHKKYPIINKKSYTRKVANVPFDYEAARLEFMKSLVDNPVKGSLDNAMREYIDRLQRKHKKENTVSVSKTTVSYKFHFVNLIYFNNQENVFPSLNGYQNPCFHKSWEGLLNNLVQNFKIFKKIFVI